MNPCTNESGRQTVIGKDGMILERAYLYLPRSTWDALHELVQRTNQNKSTLLETLLNNALASKEIANDSKCSP
jgi:hypothetical protein